MKMSVYRAGRPTAQMDHLACMKLATEATDLDLITHAFLNEKPVLTALSQVPAIIKIEEPGDAGHSFESLYDHAITLAELTRMRAHGVQSRETIGDQLYQVDLITEIDISPVVRLRLRARTERAAKDNLLEFLQGEDFQFELMREVMSQILNSGAVSWATAGFLRIADPAPAESPVWEIVGKK